MHDSGAISDRYTDPGGLNAALAAAARRMGLVDEESLARAERAAARSDARLDVTLSELGLVAEEDLSRFLASWLELDFLTPADLGPLPDVSLPWDAGFLRRAGICPASLEDGVLTLAMADPLDDPVADTIAFQHSVVVERAVATARSISEALDLAFGTEARNDGIDAEATESDIERLRDRANEGPVVQLVNGIIAAAADAGASDIHFESMQSDLVVRFRVDGALSAHRSIADSDRLAVISRLKVMARLNISERRLPQDGRLRLSVRGREIDFRLSSLPTQHGESIVLRVLDRTQLVLDWDALGFEAKMAARVEHLTQRPNGLFLVTGPTGSGKTTTLYTALAKLDAARLKILTLEDPIEYALPGINQVQIEPEIGYSFGTALRATLRQDPNVILVGEIRDLETAENAIRAALMGRMVLSTVHTNSAIGAIERLIDLGAPPYLLGSTLRGILSQRLVRRSCEACGGTGGDCQACNGSGIKGRMVIAELLEINETLAASISKGADRFALQAEAEAAGMIPLRDAGRMAAETGLTTHDEIYQVVDWNG